MLESREDVPNCQPEESSEGPNDQDMNPDDVPAVSKSSRGSKEKNSYVNPDRVNTGGLKREKISEDELTDRMARMREQNERIKQRRADVQADEEAFYKAEAADHQKLVEAQKIQESINHARAENAKRKLERIQSREWDSGKHKPKPGELPNQAAKGPWRGQRKDSSSNATREPED